MPPLLSVQNLSVTFTTRHESTAAVKNCSLTINRGELLALVGESGSGKSVTSLSILQFCLHHQRIINRKYLFTDGEKTIDLLSLSAKALQKIRGNKIGTIFQEPMTSLNPLIKCGIQVQEALLQHKFISKEKAKAETIALFEKVQLPQPDKIFNRYPHELSGGQKQRVMIAMAMCCQPLLLICDEPTTALDVTVQKSILQLIKELQQEQNMGVLFITHDLGVVSEIADRVAIMYRGEIIEQNTTDNIFRYPQQLYTKALLDCRPAQHPKGLPLPVVSDYLNKQAVVKPLVSLIEKERELTNTVIAEVIDLSVFYPVKKSFFGKPTQFFKAVNKVSFKIFKGETLGLVGESGCGKTTLGRAMLRLIEPTEGQIIFNKKDITHLPKRDLKKFRQDVQLVFQDPFSALNPRLTIGSAIEEPIKVFHQATSEKESKKKVLQLLDQVSLPAAFYNRYPHQFSGGQRQRIVIARALAMNPHFLVCDESVSALDVSVQAQVLNLLNELKKDLNLSLLFISHDLSVVKYMSNNLMVMKDGVIVESGLAEEVYSNPKTAYTKTLLASIPHI